MILPITPLDRERFRSVIARRMGLQFDDARIGLLDTLLQRRLEASRQDSDVYLSGLETGASYREFTLLAEELTVTETYLFRHIEQFRALAGAVLPDRMLARKDTKTLRLLSAGCASGEEAWSIAMVADDAIADTSWDVSVRAVDINPAGLDKARRAYFSPWALRDTPPDIQYQWFRADGSGKTLNRPTRTTISFEQKNLAADDYDLWVPSHYDVIFCRNVIMYFTPEHAAAAVERMACALAPGGFLFLGHAETLRGLSDAFHLRNTHGAFYYERKQATSRLPRSPSATARAEPTSVGHLSLPPLSIAPIDTPREASTYDALPVTTYVKAVPPPPQAWDFGQTLDMLHGDGFAAALSHVRGRPPELAGEPEILLLEAMLLAQGGEFSAAEETCERLLQIEEMNAGAHYVLALCREGAGDPVAAAEHDRVAVYLDSGFAMPRLHLGLLARRTGDRIAARRELEQALILLRREDSARLLLFGGGFSREVLMTLCRSALNERGAGHE